MIVAKMVAAIGLLFTTIGLVAVQIYGELFREKQTFAIIASLTIQQFVYLDVLGYKNDDLKEIIVSKMKIIENYVKGESR